ncbi:MAG TPA: rhodanese-like domain-containing protein [Acidimicrobiales bacterium]|nr:rhodanese-like domain-containing protein [Acidimicrobiales bacterium]
MEDSAGVGPNEAAGLVERGAVLLDVREDHEWVAGHAPHALHIPMGELAARVSELPRDRPVVCVCHVGGRSAAVTTALKDAGWNACNLAGGMEAWAAAGLAVVDEQGQQGVIV